MSEMKKIKNLKEFSTSADRFEGANLLCPGCAHSIIVREILNATNDPLILSASTGCLEVSSSVADHPLRPATRHSLGRPLPHQLADTIQANPLAE